MPGVIALAPDSFSTTTKMAGTKNLPRNVSATMPPIAAVPMIWRAMDPAPDAIHSGMQPTMKASAVIISGRKRTLAASSAASTRGVPFSYSSFQNAAIRIEFFAPKPISITKAICR